MRQQTMHCFDLCVSTVSTWDMTEQCIGFDTLYMDHLDMHPLPLTYCFKVTMSGFLDIKIELGQYVIQSIIQSECNSKFYSQSHS